MANFRVATRTQNGLAAQIAADLVGGGTIKIYDGSQPSSANNPVGSQNLLVTLNLSAPAFGGPVNGMIPAGTRAQRNASYTADATWARIQDLSGNTVWDCDVTDDGSGTINLNTIRIVSGGPVVITSFTVAVPSG